MLVGEAWDQVTHRVVEEDFYRREHRLIFRAIGELAMAGKPCDAVTLGEWFERHGETAGIGGCAYLADLANNTPSAANIAAYADIVRDKAVQRKLIEAGTQIAGDGFNPDGRDTSEILAAAEERVFKIAEAGARGREPIQRGGAALRKLLEILGERAKSPGGLTGLATGFTDLDKLTLGLQRQDLVVVAARPSMGKTAFALNIAEAAAMHAEQPVLVFSLEMSASQLMGRMLASAAHIDSQRLHSANLDDSEWDLVGRIAPIINAAPVCIDDTPALSPGDMRSRARRAKREHGLGLVIVDYLQLMQVPGNKENRATEVAEISRNLKAMAKELDVPVVALSQLNRSVEQRNDKRPVMSDLRESGAIEQDADLILFLYRDEVYDKDSPDRGIAEIIIGKQRNGPIDTVRLAFRGQYTRFDNLSASV
jgi:replicative DNA helicase